jgi:hypothetical protein
MNSKRLKATPSEDRIVLMMSKTFYQSQKLRPAEEIGNQIHPKTGKRKLKISKEGEWR